MKMRTMKTIKRKEIFFQEHCFYEKNFDLKRDDIHSLQAKNKINCHAKKTVMLSTCFMKLIIKHHLKNLKKSVLQDDNRRCKP